MIRSTSKNKPMGRYAVVIFTLVLTISGCRDTRDQPLVTSIDTSPPERVLPSPPPGLLAHLRVGPLPRVLDEVAAVGHRMGAWTIKPGELWSLVKEVMLAATDLADIVDWRRAMHLLILDPKAHPGTVAFILPVRHPDRALGQLSGRCRAHRKGALWVFTGGGRGLVPCRFVARTLSGGILVARRPAALKTVWRFALLTAQNDRGPGPSPGPSPTPGPALEARVFVNAGLTKAGLTPQKLEQLTKVGSLGLAMALGDLDAVPRLEAQLTQAFAYATSARDLGLSLDLASDEVRVRLFATAQPKGTLGQYIDGRRPAPLADLSALDRRTPLALSLAGPAVSPGAKRSKKPKHGLVLATLLSQLPGSLRKPMGRFVSRLLGHQGATQISINPLDTGGLCLVALVDHPRPQELAAAVHRDFVEGLAGLRTHLRSRGFGAKALSTPPGRKVGRMRIQEAALGGKWPARSLGLQLVLQWISGGDTLRLATTVQGQRLIIALGANAQTQIQATLRRLRASRRIARTRPLAPRRLGRARLSLVELVRAVPVLGAAMTLPKGDTGGLELHWGVDPARRQVDATLHLPLSHLMASAPLWKWLIDKIEAQTKMLGALAVPTGPEPDDAL